MESHSASTNSTASNTTNARRLIKKRLESHLSSNHRQSVESQPCLNQKQGSGSHPAATVSNSFTNASDIPDSTRHLLKPLLRAIFYGVDIVVVRELKTRRLLPAIYTNILGRLGFVWF